MTIVESSQMDQNSQIVVGPSQRQAFEPIEASSRTIAPTDSHICSSLDLE